MLRLVCEILGKPAMKIYFDGRSTARDLKDSGLTK